MQSNHFWCLLARHAGAPMPRWQQSRAPWVQGLLSVREQHEAALGRSTIVAKMLAEDQSELVPPLLDARLLLVNHDRMVLTGLERDVLTRREVAQTWLLIRSAEEPGGAGIMHPD
ncbi:hypothetical protein QRD43_20650 [Pelomonas sp. APW6]|uniref:Uncharacterized protein n=1 Tax=Roseateles subflavus TaxID=3053353 RepID=A0ABT7LN65_9BURK|nr:hypothetical protein [Pelomonas sp. APW6]MDL5034324.1 hypothetical protein [Pelomonas sp. APW6]